MRIEEFLKSWTMTGRGCHRHVTSLFCPMACQFLWTLADWSVFLTFFHRIPQLNYKVFFFFFWLPAWNRNPLTVLVVPLNISKNTRMLRVSRISRLSVFLVYLHIFINKYIGEWKCIFFYCTIQFSLIITTRTL